MILILLPLFSIILRALDHLEKSSLAYVLVCLSFSLFFYYSKKHITPKNFLISFFISGLLLLGSSPLLENDQYRYFWEGKVLSHLENPYLKPPVHSSLDFINYPERSLIAYNKLTTIYPPLALLFWRTFSSFSYQYMLVINQFLFLLLSMALMHFLMKKHIDYFQLSLLSMMLLKEFVQSVHIDLLAAFLFAYFLLSKNQGFASFLASFFTKLLSGLIIPFLWLRNKAQAMKIILWLVLLSAVFFYFIPVLQTQDAGSLSFIKNWKWNAGLYEYFLHFNLSHQTSKNIARLIFALFYIFTLLQYKNNKLGFNQAIAFIFALLFFCAHVYNPWYGIWLFIPAYLAKDKYLVLYSLTPFLGYINFEYQNLELLISLLTHGVFIFYLFSRIKIKRI